MEEVNVPWVTYVTCFREAIVQGNVYLSKICQILLFCTTFHA